MQQESWRSKTHRGLGNYERRDLRSGVCVAIVYEKVGGGVEFGPRQKGDFPHLRALLRQVLDLQKVTLNLP